MSACNTAVNRKLPNIMSTINVDQPRISNLCTTVLLITKGPEKGQTRKINQNRQRFKKLMKRALKAEEAQTDWVSRHSFVIKQADESACDTAVKQKIPNIMSKINIDEPRI